LDIVGDGPEFQRVLFTIHDLGLQERSALLGRLSSSAVRNRLRQSDVFLLSSLSEGLSNAVLEAMACAVPVVSSDCGGMSEALTDGAEGFLVPVRDPASMARALSTLAGDPALRSRMGTAARNRILRDFHRDHQLDRMTELFTAVAGCE
jgi:colanic acid/amylovoran biosynthesis glycosyltransferase